MNINYVFGMSDAAPQAMMAPALWLLLLIAGNIALFHLPTHLLLRRVAPQIQTI